jgi:hypothetical protein
MKLAGKYKQIGQGAVDPFLSRRDLVNRQQWTESTDLYTTEPAIRQELNKLLGYLELADPGSQQALQLQTQINALRGQAFDALS